MLLHQFEDFHLQGSPLWQLLISGVFLLGPSRSTLLVGVLDFAKLLIGSVQLGCRQFLVPAFAKAVDGVDAGVVYRPGERMLGDLV